MSAPEVAAPGYRRIVLPLPYALSSVNAYLVEGSDATAIVDCGLHTADGERALREGLASLTVREAFVTHLHPDHIGMAGWLERSGARVHMHGPEVDAAAAMWFSGSGRIDTATDWFTRHGMPTDVLGDMREAWLDGQRSVDPLVDVVRVADGATVLLAGRRFRVVWTPGHTDHHAVLYDEDERVLVAGDCVLPKITPNIGWYPFSRDDPLGDFLASLEKLATLDVRRVLPAHGRPFDDLRGRVDEIRAHHQVRLDAVREALSTGPIDAYRVARQLFPLLRSAHEERFAHAEVLAHLRYLEKQGEVRQSEGTPVRWEFVRH